MSIDDKRHRRYLVIQLSTAQQSIDISIPDSRGLLGIELTGYQFSGAPVIAGVPVSLAYYVAFTDSTTSTELLATNNGTPLAGVSGVPCQLTGAFTSQQYDTPRLMASRAISQYGLPANMRLNVSVRDELGQLAVFTAGRIYCNLVYDQYNSIDMSASVTRSQLPFLSASYK